MMSLMNVQVGWQQCIACSDSKTRKGFMWLGGNNYMQCPVCKGTCEVPKYKQVDISTGKEVNYENRI